MYLFFDTETTGLCDFTKPLDDPKQPYICQFAMVLTDKNLKEVAVYKTLVKPDGWILTPELTKIHGITTDDCEKYGLPIRTVLLMFRKFQDMATIKIAHNYRFDGFICKSMHTRIGLDAGEDIEKFCTMKAMTEAMNLPPTEKMQASGLSYPKSAKLSEAYKFVTGKDLDGAHDGLIDARACKEVFGWILQNDLLKPQPRKGPPKDDAK